MPLPAAAHDASQTVVGRQSILVITPAGGAAVNLLFKLLDYEGTLEIGRIAAPSATLGPTFTARTWDKSRQELLKGETDELDKVITLLGSLTGRKVATCTAYIRDPDDDAAKVAYKSDEFPCTIYRDSGSLRFSGDDATKVTLVIESNKDGAITWSKDASVA